MENIKDADCVIMAVAHKEFVNMNLEELKKLYRTDLLDHEKVLIDVKGIYSIEQLKTSNLQYWRL